MYMYQQNEMLAAYRTCVRSFFKLARVLGRGFHWARAFLRVPTVEPPEEPAHMLF